MSWELISSVVLVLIPRVRTWCGCVTACESPSWHFCPSFLARVFVVFFSPVHVCSSIGCVALCASMRGAFQVPEDDLTAHCQFILSLITGLGGQGSADALCGSAWVTDLSLGFSVQKLLQRKELCGLGGIQCLRQPLSCSPRASPGDCPPHEVSSRMAVSCACACWGGNCHSAGVLHEKSGT